MTGRMDPAALRQYAATLRPGIVLRLHQPVAEKIKRHVLISTAPDRSLAFIINSRPSPFVQSKPELLRRQVPILKAEHPFMQWDSVIACHDTVRLDPINVLAAGICDGTVQRLGYIQGSVFDLIRLACEDSRTISARDLKLIAGMFAYRLRK